MHTFQYNNVYVYCVYVCCVYVCCVYEVYHVLSKPYQLATSTHRNSNLEGLLMPKNPPIVGKCSHPKHVGIQLLPWLQLLPTIGGDDVGECRGGCVVKRVTDKVVEDVGNLNKLWLLA